MSKERHAKLRIRLRADVVAHLIERRRTIAKDLEALMKEAADIDALLRENDSLTIPGILQLHPERMRAQSHS
jgi:putative heme iron utilization protein